MPTAIQSFKPGWIHARGLTRDFIECVPEERWAWSPHSRYGELRKQFRHMICVEGVYIDGLVTGHADFRRKHLHYDGALTRTELLEGLGAMDARLDEALDAIGEAGEEAWSIDFYGNQTLGTFLNTFLYHEALHQGQWSYYATLGGFPTPESWRLNWGL